MNILVTIPVDQDVTARFEETAPGAAFRYVSTENVTREDIMETDILIGLVSPELIQASPRLKLFQLNLAGANTYCLPGILHEDTILCNSTGAYGVAVSEHMLASIFALTKKLNRYECNRKKHIWRDEGSVMGIFGSTTLVIGAGDIGSEFGHKMHLLGSKVTGIRRHTADKPDWLEAIYPLEKLDDIIGDFDIVALSIPNTKATAHLIDMNRLKKMKKSAILINVGRGNAIVTDDLCKALNEGIIAGAAVDVTDPEPLPPENPLWDAPNMIITPHTSGQYHLPETFERIVRLAAENLRAYTTGQPLKSLVDFNAGYRSFDARKN